MIAHFSLDSNTRPLLSTTVDALQGNIVSCLFRRTSFTLCSICIVLAWWLSSCNDTPGPIGSELAPSDSLLLRIITNDTLDLIRSSAIGQETTKMATDLALTTSSTPFFLGAAESHEGKEVFTAAAFIRYQIPVRNDSIRTADFAALTENDIIDARLFLRPATCLLGDTIGKIAPFRVYEARQRWYDDSINTAQNVPNPQSFLNSSQQPLASYAQELPALEGIGVDAGAILNRKRSFVLNDKAMILRWLKADSAQWANNIFGLVLVPSSAARAVYGFNQSSYIIVRFRNPADGSERSINIFEDAQITRSMASIPNNPGGEEIIVQGGVALRSALSFDVRAIPSLSTIHQAELILPVDSARSLISTCGLPTAVQLSFSSPKSKFAIDSSIRITARGQLNTTTGTMRYIFSSGTSTNPNMLGIIQQLVKTGGQGDVLLHLEPQFIASNAVLRSDEEQMFNRIVFRRLRGSADAAFRPRLVITYSLRPR